VVLVCSPSARDACPAPRWAPPTRNSGRLRDPAGAAGRRCCAVVTGGLYLLARRFSLPQAGHHPARAAPRNPRRCRCRRSRPVLFSVESQLSGPWRVGSLDVYDGKDWRLPAFSDPPGRRPPDGVVTRTEAPASSGHVSPSPVSAAPSCRGWPNTVASWPKGRSWPTTTRSGALRVPRGQVQAGLKYTVAAAALPNVEDLRHHRTQPAASTASPRSRAPPPAVADLLDKAPKSQVGRVRLPPHLVRPT